MKDAKGVGNLAAATADVWLVRTGIEGSRRFALGGGTAGMVLTPSFELGARLDGGDAETGLGVDLGGELAFAAPKQGVALDLKARGLIAHEASGFREWGASASLTWDPRPSTDRGLALRLRQGWGGSPTGGMDALLGRETLAGLAANDNGDTTASAGRLEAELGYGIALFGGGFTGTPHLGFGLSDTARDYARRCAGGSAPGRAPVSLRCPGRPSWCPPCRSWNQGEGRPAGGVPTGRPENAAQRCLRSQKRPVATSPQYWTPLPRMCSPVQTMISVRAGRSSRTASSETVVRSALRRPFCAGSSPGERRMSPSAIARKRSTT